MAPHKAQAPKYGAPLYCAGWASPDVALVAGGGGKASSGIPNRIIALDVPAGAPFPSATEAASLPCEAAPLRLVLEPPQLPSSSSSSSSATTTANDDKRYAAVALAGGVIARLEVSLSPPPVSMTLRPGGEKSSRSSKRNTEDEQQQQQQQQQQQTSPSKSPGKNTNKNNNDDNNNNNSGNNNGNGGSPVGAAGRAVAGLTAAAVGAIPRVLFRTLPGNNVSSSSSSSSASSSCTCPCEVKALAFSADASLLAAGGEDGVVRLFSWPSLSQVAEVRPASASAAASPPSAGSEGGVRDLDFGPASTDGGAHLLAVVLESGAASVWRAGAGISSAAPLATLPPPPRPAEVVAAAAAGGQKSTNGGGGGGKRIGLPPRPATVARLRFDRSPPPASVRLVAAVNHPSAGGFLASASARATSSPADPGAPPLALSWSPLPAANAAAVSPTPTPPSSKLPPPPPPRRVLRAPITAFDVSRCGRLVGAGSSDGDVVVARSTDDFSVVAASRGKHMVFVTAVSFAPPLTSAPPGGSAAAATAAAAPPALLSVSADASAALTVAPASALRPRRSCLLCSSSAAMASAVARFLTLAVALLVLLAFLAEAVAARAPAACRVPSSSSFIGVLRSLGLAPAAPPPRSYRFFASSSSAPSLSSFSSPKKHLEDAAATLAALASERCRSAVAGELRRRLSLGSASFRGVGGGDGEL